MWTTLFDRRRGRAAAILFGVVSLLGVTNSWAQSRSAQRTAETPEVAPFRMTGIEGFLLGKYWQDSNNNITGDANSKQTLSNLSGEVFVMTHNYVYHPNLLLLDLGAGPAFYHQGYATDGVDTKSNRFTYNLSARATILRDKPYRGGIFYELMNDSQPVGPAQSLLTENTRYGFDFALLAPVTPMPIRIDANRYHTKGKGTNQVIDDRIDEYNFRTEKTWGKLGDTTFRYQAIQDDSQSGSLGLPIQTTRSRSGRADLDTSLDFGAENRYGVTNAISLYTQNFSGDQGLIVDTSQFRFDVNFRGRPSDGLQTRARYQFDALDQTTATGDQSANLNAVNAGVTWQATPELGTTVDATATFNRNTVYTANATSISGSVNYRKPLSLGEMMANVGLVYLLRDQTATEPVAQVVGERATLGGTSWVPLRRPQVIASTVVVSNAQRTQTFVEGVDYTLREIGLVTEIQRLVAGNILDGQEVLIDYEHDTGGTFALADFANTADLSWSFKNYFSIYARYYDSSPRLISGLPTSPLNPTTVTTFGTRADVPFELAALEVKLGGFAEWEDRREVISPYQRTTYEAYVESSLPLIARGAIRIGALQQDTAYVYTPIQDVNSTTYNLRLWSRFRNGLGLSIDATRTTDKGAPQVARQYTMTSAKAVWRIRRFLLTFDLSRTRETQGITQATHTMGEIKLRRDF